jgi:competence protein ComEC
MSQSEIPHRSAFAHYPLATLALSFALGIVCARYAVSSLFLFILLGSVSSILTFCFFTQRRQFVTTALLGFAFFCSGATLFVLEKRSIAPDRIRRLYDEGVVASDEPIEITGVLQSAPEPAPGGFYLALKVTNAKFRNNEMIASGVVSLFAFTSSNQVRSEYDALELRYGARVRVMTALSRSDTFRNPGVSSFKDFLDQRGIDATGAIKSPTLVERLDDERVFLPLARLFEWRQSLLSSINEKFSPETAGVLGASLLGNRYLLSRSAAERFRDGGTFHVLVISGLHISFIGLVVLLVMRRITSHRGWQFAVTVVFLWSYTLAVGAEASVVRAALMFSVVALGPVLHRRSNSLNALGGAGLALLIWRPSDLLDPSFQLTFGSVFAIVALAWPLLSHLRDVGVWRPTRATPLPPSCPGWWRTLGELLYWSERKWQEELNDSPWRCRLFKLSLASRVEQLHLQRPLRYVVAAVVVSTAVQMMLLPFLVLYFHRLSIASLVLNIVVGVLMAVLLFCALAVLLLSEVNDSVATVISSMTEATNWLMIHSVDPFEAIRLASYRLPEYTGWASIVYGLYYLPLVILILKLNRWRPIRNPSVAPKQKPKLALSITRVAACGLAIAFSIIVWHPGSAGKPDSRLRIDFLDVGQGDAALVTMPDGTTVLVDGGGQASFGFSTRSADEVEGREPLERDRRSIGEAVVSEYLWWLGLDRVDYIVATHTDADHIDGLNDVARNFVVRCALIARQPKSDQAYSRFASTLERAGIPVKVIARGDSLRFGDVTLDVLWPAQRANINAPSRNDDSVVIRLSFGERAFLLTGDIEKRTEFILTDGTNHLKSDVVKVAHHGSRTSSIDKFVNATRPSLAVISVGLRSVYGHPHKEVVERWRASGAEVLTTGQRGMISISTNGHDLDVKTFVTSSDLK